MTNSNNITPYFDQNNKLVIDSKNHYLVARTRVPLTMKPEYAQVHFPIGDIAYNFNSINVYKVMLYLMTQYAHCPVVKSTRLPIVGKDIAKTLSIATPEVSRCLKVLEQSTFILSKGYGFVVLNPKYVWKGTLQDREQEMKLLSKEISTTGTRTTVKVIETPYFKRTITTIVEEK